MPTPNWSAARNGLPADTNAVDKSAQINQFLGTHGVTEIYAGSEIITPNGGRGTGALWDLHLDTNEFDQPFTMSGTVLGRIALPVLPVGNGADLQVSLCADSAGVPGTVLNTVRIPANWISSLAISAGAAGPSSSLTLFKTGNPLATSVFNTYDYSFVAFQPTINPSADSSGPPGNPSVVYAGNYIFIAGGSGAGGAALVFTWTQPWQGTKFGTATPQPSLPVATIAPGVAFTPDFVVVAGGLISGVATTNVYVASWNANTGQVGSWSAQAALPTAMYNGGTCSSGETVYVQIGNLRTVYYATVANGQITSWNTAPPLPIPLNIPLMNVIQGFLVVAGGQTTGGVYSNACYYAPINADGSIGGWQSGPTMPAAVAGWLGNPVTAMDSGLVQIYPTNGNRASFLPFTTHGPGAWQYVGSGSASGPNPSAIFSNGDGTFALSGGMNSANYAYSIVYPQPLISIPLPTTGLTNGTKYHILLHQQGGDLNNYLRMVPDTGTLPLDLQTRPSTGGSWTTYTAGLQMPIQFYDQTVSGQLLHTWEDSGKRITTFVQATTPDARLLGICEATQFLDGTLESSVNQINYPGTWPAGAWPPLGVTQIA